MGIEVGGARGQADWIDSRVLQDTAKGGAELGVSIHQHITFADQETSVGSGQITSNLFHPAIVGVRRHARKVNPTGSQFHYEEQIVRDQATLAPDFDGGEIDGGEHVPMRFQKRLPGGLPLTLRGWLDAMLLQDVPHGRVGEAMAEVGERPLNAVVAPTGILGCQADDEVPELVGNGQSSGLLATSAIVPFLGDEQAVPAQDGVRRYQRADLGKKLAAKDLGFDSQPSALVVVEEDAMVAELFAEDLVFSAQVVDDLLLLAIDPACEDEEQELPRLQDEIHGRPGEVKGRS